MPKTSVNKALNTLKLLRQITESNDAPQTIRKSARIDAAVYIGIRLTCLLIMLTFAITISFYKSGNNGSYYNNYRT